MASMPRPMPNTGTRPFSSWTRARISGASRAETGPLESRTPSGLKARMSFAGVLNGTMVTLQPRSLSRERMLCLMPQSTATTWYRWLEVRVTQRLRQPTRRTRSVGRGVAAMRARASSLGMSASTMAAMGRPVSRMILVSIRVSTPLRQGIPCSSSSSSRVLV